MTLSEAFDLYRSDCILFTNQSRKTEEQHQITKKSLLAFTGDIPLESLTFDIVRDWKSLMERKNRSAGTIRGYQIKLRVVLAYMRKRGYTCLDPELIHLPKRQQRVPKFIGPEDIQKLIDAQDKARVKHILRARNKAIIALLFSSGIRNSELCSMDISDAKYDFFTVVGKGGVGDPSFIDERARGYINAYLAMRKDNCPALFVSDMNKLRITPGTLQEILKYARKNAGFSEQITPHVLRHSFATDLMRNGCDTRYVQKLMHHKSIETTQVYLHVVDEELRSLHQKYHTA